MLWYFKNFNAWLFLGTEFFYSVVMLFLLKYKIRVLLPPLLQIIIHSSGTPCQNRFFHCTVWAMWTVRQKLACLCLCGVLPAYVIHIIIQACCDNLNLLHACFCHSNAKLSSFLLNYYYLFLQFRFLYFVCARWFYDLLSESMLAPLLHCIKWCVLWTRQCTL